MKGNKGFTLVELLAVIVLLALIAVISTPIILGYIDDARKGAAEDKTWGTIDAIKYAYSQEDLDSATPGNDGYYNVKDLVNSRIIKISGEKPTDGKFKVNDNGEVDIVDFKFGDYTCNYNKITSNETTTTDYTKIECSK